MKEITEDKEIIKTWLTGESSCTLVIPKRLARDLGIDKPSHLLIKKTAGGLLISKLEI
jgi:hypothetical protein